MSQDSTIQIKIGAVEVNCRGEIDSAQLDQVLASLKARLPELLSADAAADTRVTLPELLAAADTRSFGDKAGVVAFWLEEHRGRAHWRSADITEALEEIGEETPANITDALNQKLKKGLFEVEDRRWKLTGEGRGWVKWKLLGSA